MFPGWGGRGGAGECLVSIPSALVTDNNRLTLTAMGHEPENDLLEPSNRIVKEQVKTINLPPTRG